MNDLETPSRPALRYHGGKWLLAPWIIEHFPPHRVYVEPFGGAASVLIRKPRSYAEVYNDLDDGVVGLFRVLRNPATCAALVERICLTPFSRAEFVAAYEDTDCEIERARRLIIRSFMGFGSDGFNIDVRTGFRATSNRSGTTPAHDWANYPPPLAAVGGRMVGVVIENKPAIEVMRQQDGPETLHYVDPPYLPETRSPSTRVHAYRHEMTPSEHEQLLAFLRNLSGAVVLSGYPSEMYDAALYYWRRVERKALADGARERREVLWINRSAAARLDRAKHQPSLFTA